MSMNDPVSPVHAHTQYGQTGNQEYVEKEVVPGMAKEVVPAAKEVVSAATYPYSVEISGQPRATSRDTTICGMSRKMCCIVIAAFSIVLAISVGVGIGAGIAISRSMSRDSSVVPSGGSAITITQTGSATQQRTTDSSASSVTSATSPTPTSTAATCPGADLTYYFPPRSAKRFLRLCNVDYSGGNTTDLSSASMSTFSSCIDLCAVTPACIACGWGEYESVNTCFMKSSLGTSDDASDSGWSFALIEA